MKRTLWLLALGLPGMAAVVGLMVAHGQGREGNKTFAISAPPQAAVRQASGAADKLTLPKETWEKINAHDAPGHKMEREALTLLRQGQLDEAEQKCRQALAFFQGTWSAASPRALLGNIQFAKGEYQKALNNYDIALQHGTNDIPLYMALCYVRLGDLEKAKQACSEATLLDFIYLSPQEADKLPGVSTLPLMEASLLLALGAREYSTGQPQIGLAYLEPAGKLAPQNWLIANTTGDALYDLKRYKEAVPYYLRAEQYSGGKTSYRTHQRAHPEKYLGVPANAPREPAQDGLAPYQEAKQQARRLFNEGKLKEAEAVCRRAAELAYQVKSGLSYDPASPRYRDEDTLLGDILLAQGRNSEALVWYLQASLRPGSFSPPPDPAHPPLNLNAALVFCRQGHFSMARAHAPDKAIAPKASPEQWAQWPGSGDIRALEASLLLARGLDEASAARYQEALFFLKQAAKLAPGNTLIAQALSQAQHGLKPAGEAAP